MNPRTRKKVALLARRLLAAQLEVDPKSKSDIVFTCNQWYCRIGWYPRNKEWSWNLNAARGAKSDFAIPF